MKSIKREILFYILLIVYLSTTSLIESQFNEIAIIGNCLRIIEYGTIFLVIVFAVVKNKSARKNTFITIFILFSVLILNYFINNGGLSIIPLVMIAWASKNYPLDKTFKLSFMSILFAYLFVILSANIGILNDDVSYLYRLAYTGRLLAGEYYRHTMGFHVHNQVPIAFFSLYMMFISARKNAIKWYESTVFVLLDFLIYYLFGSRVVFILILATCLIYYVIRIKKRYKRRSKTSKIANFSFPICCFISFFISINYRSTSSFYSQVDHIFSNRVRLAHEALAFYGVHLFGAGQYAGTYNSTVLSGNNVDNGYITFFIQNGLIAGIIVVGIWTYITVLSVRSHNSYVTLSLVMIALENMVNPHLGSYLMVPYYCIITNYKDCFISIDTYNNETQVNKSIIRLKHNREYIMSRF